MLDSHFPGRFYQLGIPFLDGFSLLERCSSGRPLGSAPKDAPRLAKVRLPAGSGVPTCKPDPLHPPSVRPLNGLEGGDPRRLNGFADRAAKPAGSRFRAFTAREFLGFTVNPLKSCDPGLKRRLGSGSHGGRQFLQVSQETVEGRFQILQGLLNCNPDQRCAFALERKHLLRCLFPPKNWLRSLL
ncbi:hypothetical protein L345_14260, partial [Ophiophagus hannah]